jgi:hypothetical protein
MPASAAPPATSGVFAFDASWVTFSPALATGPFGEVVRGLGFFLVARAVDFLVRVELFRFRDVRDADEPFRLVDLLELEPLRPERVFERCVAWAIFLGSPSVASLRVWIYPDSEDLNGAFRVSAEHGLTSIKEDHGRDAPGKLKGPQEQEQQRVAEVELQARELRDAQQVRSTDGIEAR